MSERLYGEADASKRAAETGERWQAPFPLDRVAEQPPRDQPGSMEVAGSPALQIRQSPAPQIQRPARGLIGWMAPDAAIRFLNGNTADGVASGEQQKAIDAARRAVSERDEFRDSLDTVGEPDAELEPYLEKLRSDPAASGLLASGWAVAQVDLKRVIAFQPTVFSDSAIERVADVDPSSWESIARVTLPITAPESLPVQFDPARKCFHVVSRNPNLQAVQPFAGPVATPQGIISVIGFVVGAPTSFLVVGEFDSRYYLRDGYHRAYGLLHAGISTVPGLVRHIDTIEELVPPGMLPQAAYRGPRPPFVADYLDDVVATTVLLPAQQRLVAIQALELSPVI